MIRSKRKEKSVKLNLAPLLDMVFILLIFFVLTTSFIQLVGRDINLPKSSTTQKLSNTLIFIGITDNGSYYINEQRLSTSRLKRYLARKAHTNKKTGIALVADQNTPIKYLVTVMDISNQVGISDISIAKKEIKSNE